jgi:uncharacterized protein (TIGR00255 family)
MLEDKIKGLIAESITRGRIEISVQIRENTDEAMTFEINEPLAAAYHKALAYLKNKFDLEGDINLGLLASASGIIKPAEPDRDMDTCWIAVKDCVTGALFELNEMRNKEGNFIFRDIAGRLDYIEQCVRQIESEATELLSIYQERLKERISALTNGMVDIDPSRIAQEAAILADRSDISEEIVRAGSHIQQFRDIMNSEESAGRKLNFLLQEFNREFNTMGAKASNSGVSHIIVDVKSELEKIREQIQNIE